MNEERLKEIDKERELLYSRLGELDEEVYRLENADALEVVEGSIGKYYWNKNSGIGMTGIFHPKKASNRTDLNITLYGEYVLETSLLIGNVSVYVTNSQPIRVDEFKRDYEEITKEEYEEKKSRMLNFFLKD